MGIAEKILKIMKERDITPYRLSKDTGVPYTTLSKILNGTTKSPQVSSLQTIADYLQKPLDFFTENNADSEQSIAPEWATAKDKRDLEKYLEDMGPLFYKGIEFSEEDKAKMLGVAESIFWDAKKKNKEAYKKSRQKNKDN